MRGVVVTSAGAVAAKGTNGRKHGVTYVHIGSEDILDLMLRGWVSLSDGDGGRGKVVGVCLWEHFPYPLLSILSGLVAASTSCHHDATILASRAR